MKWDIYVEKIITFISNVIFSMMFLVVLLQIGGRYLMKNPFIWTEELARSLYVWLIFLGSATLLKEYEHISIDFIPRKLSAAGQLYFKVVIDVIGFAFYVFLIIGGVKMMKNTHSMRMPCIPQIRMSYLYLSVVIGAVASNLFLFINILQNLKKSFTKSEVQ